MRVYHHTSLENLQRILEDKKLQTLHQKMAQEQSEKGHSRFPKIIELLKQVNARRRQLFEEKKINEFEYMSHFIDLDEEAETDTELKRLATELKHSHLNNINETR